MSNQLRQPFKIHLLRIVLLCLVIGNGSLFAHGEEIELKSGPKGPVVLSVEQEQMLQLKVVKASNHPLAELLSLNGQIELLPNAQADVGVRISGSVVAIDANLGENVKVGQRLATVQSRLIGNPPPIVAVTAPIAGIIDARNVTLGQAVEPNTVLFHISNRDLLLVIAKVYEEDLGKVKPGQETNIHVLSYPKKVFAGRVTLIEPNLDVVTRTVNVQISLNNKEGLLKPGMFVRSSLVLSKNDSALAIPNAALLEANGERFVFVRHAHRYERVEVETGSTDDDYTEITAGLSSGDEVVTQGNRQLYTLWLSGSHSESSEEDHQ